MSGMDIKSDRVSEYWAMGCDTISYVIFTNPVSATVIDSMKAVVSDKSQPNLNNIYITL